MPSLNCYTCHHRVRGGLSELVKHFRRSHGLTIKRGVGSSGFECGQEGCRRRFYHFYDMKRHIRKIHLDSRAQEINDGFHQILQDAVIDDYMDQEAGGGGEEAGGQRKTLEEDVSLDLKLSVVRMVARLHSKGSMTGAIVQEVIDECEDILSECVTFFKAKVRRFLKLKNLERDPDASTLLDNFDFQSPFNGLRNIDQQVEALKTHCNYIEPMEYPLGYRMDRSLDRESGTYIPALLLETCEYVPIIETLRMVLSNKEVFNAIHNERPSPDDELNSFIDGDHFKSHPFLQLYKHAIRIQMYYDELEIVNPLGSKTGIHKLGAFYFTIQNLPSHMNSELSSIHVLTLCADEDAKKYGFKKILSPFFKDLKLLESDAGVQIDLKGEPFTLRATVVAFCGDTLAVHEVFNFKGPAANQVCRSCSYSREDLLNGKLDAGEEKTEQVYNNLLNYVKTRNFSEASMTETGLKGDCCLHQSKYFHVSRNKIWDGLHDILCHGTGAKILKLVLSKFALGENKLFTVEWFNAKVSSFQYGYVERKHRPSPNFCPIKLARSDSSLSQKGMQVWLLLRAFPFLVADKVPQDNEHMQLILLQLRILEYIFAPRLRRSDMPYLRALIQDLLDLFQKLFPDEDLINKFHHLVHYPESMLWAGPSWGYNCLWYEAKHGELKLLAQCVHNFKNPPKTLIRVSQCSQSARWGAGDVQSTRVKALNGKCVRVDDTLSAPALSRLNYVEADKVFQAKGVRVNGVEFRLGLYVCLSSAVKNDDDLPQFGKIVEILLLNDSDVNLLVSPCLTLNFNPFLNAFAVDLRPAENAHEAPKLIPITSLSHYKPLSPWTEPVHGQAYFSMRHIIL